jgi:serine/threonine protein phosphatase 1
MKSLSRLLGSRQPERRPLKRIALPEPSGPVYAVGDVHGCLDALLALEDEIFADAAHFPEPRLLIMLGDYVDRGPASAQLIDHLMQPMPDGFSRLCLAGNHELVMLDYLEGRGNLEDWLRYGAEATLASYGVDTAYLAKLGQGNAERDMLIRQAIPVAHLQFLRQLAIVVEMPGFAFVHAGILPDMPLDRQSDWQLATVRKSFEEKAHLSERVVVHGHTPVEQPLHMKGRVNLDTGACFTGQLTGIRLWHNTGRYLSSRPGGNVRPAVRA